MRILTKNFYNRPTLEVARDLVGKHLVRVLDDGTRLAGRIVETADARTLFFDMRHPYTEALLRSIPRIDDPVHHRLDPIPGRPPELISPPDACAFAPRCLYAQADCLDGVPELSGLVGLHRFACLHPTGTERGEAAVAANRAAGVTVAGLSLTGDPGGTG